MIINVILFLTVGFILFLIELLTPGFGLVGISGILLLIIGCYISYTKISFVAGIFVSLLSLLLVIFFFKLFSKSIIWKKIRLDLREEKKEGFTLGDEFLNLLNKEGITLSVLRPSGIAKIDGRKIDVIAKDLFIEKDRKIRVVEVSGSKVVVKEIK